MQDQRNSIALILGLPALSKTVVATESPSRKPPTQPTTTGQRNVPVRLRELAVQKEKDMYMDTEHSNQALHTPV